jgi:hypothetical protein
MAKSELRTKAAILRAAIGISMKEFAALTGRSFFTWKALEAGRLPVSEGLASKISEQSGVDMDWLLNDERSGPPVDQQGNPITEESFAALQTKLLHLSQSRDVKQMKIMAVYLARKLANVLQEIAEDPEHFHIAHYRTNRFVNDLRKEFLSSEPPGVLSKAWDLVFKKSSGSKKKRP